MAESKERFKNFLIYLIAFLTLCILATYTYAKFFAIPYIGFIFNPSDGSIINVFDLGDSVIDLQAGDKLIQIGSVQWVDYTTDLQTTLFDNQNSGMVVDILVLRENQELKIPWRLPGPNKAEVWDRINGVLLLAYPFWFAGMATILLVRPRDTRWLLMAIFYFSTAAWLACGSISAWHIWNSAIVLRMVIWMCLPVYLHFHWIFPKPLGRIPPFIWMGLYVGATFMAGLELLQILPRVTYYFVFLVALLGSFLLLVFHIFIQSKYRRDVRLLIGASAFAMTPALVLSLTGSLNRTPWFGGLALLAFPILPGAYFYAVYYRQIGGLRIRTNRQISMYIYFILIGISCAILIPIIVSRLASLDAAAIVAAFASLVIAIISVALFPLFQRFFEHRILGVPLAPTHLVEIYSVRITTSLNRKDLMQLLKDKILPSLLIRQSALLQIDNNDKCNILYTTGVDATQLPTNKDFSGFLAKSGKYLPIHASDNRQVLPWIRLILPLNVEGRLIGLWFLGSRDPDDIYSQSEISVLQTIANHTAVALINITQAERLHMLYQSNIERQEIERVNLARDLHDEILNQLATLSMNVDQENASNFTESYKAVTSRIRQMVSGLRPAMLTYGLYAAIEELMDNISERSSQDLVVTMGLSPSNARYSPKIEEYLYRIVQEACENALQHAHARSIRISGSLDPTNVVLVVEDDGIGFQGLEDLSFEMLLATKHYGFAGMHERAAIIGAELYIDTIPGGGTRLSIKKDLTGNESKVNQ